MNTTLRVILAFALGGAIGALLWIVVPVSSRFWFWGPAETTLLILVAAFFLLPAQTTGIK